MARVAAILIVCGALCYVAGPLVLHLRTSPIAGYATGDVMLALVMVGTLMIAAGVMIVHRRHLRQKQLDNG